MDELAAAQLAGIAARLADLRRQEAAVKAHGAEVAEQLKTAFLEARAKAGRVRAGTESRDLAVEAYFAEGEVAGERRTPLAAWGCLALPPELKGWSEEFHRMVEQSSRGWTP